VEFPEVPVEKLAGQSILKMAERVAGRQLSLVQVHLSVGSALSSLEAAAAKLAVQSAQWEVLFLEVLLEPVVEGSVRQR
jgi:hypothetical protein